DDAAVLNVNGAGVQILVGLGHGVVNVIDKLAISIHRDRLAVEGHLGSGSVGRGHQGAPDVLSVVYVLTQSQVGHFGGSIGVVVVEGHSVDDVAVAVVGDQYIIVVPPITTAVLV